MPRDEGFYPLFSEAAVNLAEAARLLRDLLADFDNAPAFLKLVVQCERRGDELTRSILRRVHSSFVTPFDREDIHTLTEELDDAVDDIHAAAEILILHGVEMDKLPPEIHELADILVLAADATVDLIALLPSLKGMEPYLEKIDRLESEADSVYRRSVAHLFSGEFKAFAVLRAKDVVEGLENAVNGIENISDIVETILLKHA